MNMKKHDKNKSINIHIYILNHYIAIVWKHFYEAIYELIDINELGNKVKIKN